MVPSELPIGSVLCSTKTRDVWSRSFRTYFVLSSFIEHDDQAKYVKRHASYIETTDQLFEYLSLAELDEEEHARLAADACAAVSYGRTGSA